MKTVYKEYTDGTFTTQKPQAEQLGILGPVIRGEQGDKITVYFKVRVSDPSMLCGEKGYTSAYA